jgi:hypothetical protein
MNRIIFDLYFDRKIARAGLKNERHILRELALDKEMQKNSIKLIKAYKKEIRSLSRKIFCTWFELHVGAWWLEYEQIVQYFAVGFILTALVAFTIYQGVK